MKADRLDLACSAGLLPALEGRIAVYGQITADRLSAFERSQLFCVSPSRVVNDALGALGYAVSAELEVSCAHALVLLPRAKAEAQALIAAAVATAPKGLVIVDGQKTDGIESIAKQIRHIVQIAGSYSKAHGKTIWFEAAGAEALLDWRAPKSQTVEGFVTAPGVFSADSIDPASALLAAHLPADLTGTVVDLGAGWGYLSARLLEHAPGVARAHLVEDNTAALACALQNVKDARAQCHWADALNWRCEGAVDTVIMNPPFHIGRAADHSLGQAFIRAAAALLRPGGQLFMVANAHLPYGPVIEACFARSETLAATRQFVVTRAEASRAKMR